jgi:ribonuclease R
MDILPVEREFFERRMFAMERDGQVIRNRRGAYLLPAKADLIRGTVQGHPDGYGFVVTDDEGRTSSSAPTRCAKCSTATG